MSPEQDQVVVDAAPAMLELLKAFVHLTQSTETSMAQKILSDQAEEIITAIDESA